ncbi:major facilitator superfamily domain-containing protein 12-like [Acropora millepora]|uniref:major facilitator superfamily domain-containing protein 12-like n=1 Tax=Acropora millepora TaxID=45264 RepID=UPI001CF58B6B|nr:major facilitator superfamily domain-containing protein 12-like [Acropora millepora]
MASSRDITAASTASNSDVEDISENTTSSIRNRIACRTGDVLNNLTLSVWYSYALLFLQNVAGLSPTSVGILFLVSQILMAVTLIVIYLGYDKQLWKLFTAYGIQKARHVVSSAGILFAWPFAFTPCLICGDGRSNLALGMYYLIPVVLLSVCWELAELSFSSLRKEIREGNDSEISRSITRVCKVFLYIVLWFLLQESKETSVNSNIKEQFAYLVLILLPVGFAFVFAFHLTVLEARVQIERTRETNEGEQLEKGAPSASVKLPQLEGSLGLTWIQWLKEPLLYKVGSVGVFSKVAFRLVQCYLPLYLTETLKLRKESVAFFPLIIVITRVVVEMFCKRGIYKVKIRVIIVCTTAAIFGTSLWYYLHTEERTSLVYAPTVIFASMSSLLTMVTPTLHQELTANEKENSSFVHGVFECSERAILGVIVFTIQMFYPDSTKSSSVGEFLRITFPAVLGTTIVIPLVVATAFMTSNDSHEGMDMHGNDQVTAATSPGMENGPNLPLMNCFVDRLVSSERSTPALDIEQGEGQRRTGRDYSELQAAPSDAEQEGNHFHSQRDQVVSTSTAVPSDTPSEETQSHSERDQEIQEVKKALDELHRLPSTDL